MKIYKLEAFINKVDDSMGFVVGMGTTYRYFETIEFFQTEEGAIKRLNELKAAAQVLKLTLQSYIVQIDINE